jgi:hypothetical protein
VAVLDPGLYEPIAAGGLAESGNPEAIGLLARHYFLTDQEDLKASIVSALGACDDHRAVEELRTIRSRESDPGLLEVIDQTLEDREHE